MSKEDAINFVEYDKKTDTYFIRIVGTSPTFTTQQRIDLMAASEDTYKALKKLSHRLYGVAGNDKLVSPELYPLLKYLYTLGLEALAEVDKEVG